MSGVIKESVCSPLPSLWKRANVRPLVESFTDFPRARSFRTQKKGMDLNYPRNIDRRRINHLDLVGRRGKMRVRVEEVIVPRLLLLNGLTMRMTILERERRMRKRMERMIILLLIGIQRMILRIHRIGMSPPAFPLVLFSSSLTVADK